MNILKDGGPAFPVTIQQGSTKGLPGLTLRDYFAAAALQGLLASPQVDGSRRAIAQSSYDLADAMLARRAKTTQAEKWEAQS